jgi:hypothetical protein
MFMAPMLRERLPLDPGERESVPIWRIQTGVLSGVLHSGAGNGDDRVI